MMISDLPEELETEILSRVPATSLAKLKTTCKRWYALFKDPIFVKKNFAKSLSEVIILTNSGVYPISLGLDAIQNRSVPTTELTGKLIRLKHLNLKTAEIFHCTGLLLCVGIYNSGIVVWNPCTGETRWVNPREYYHKDDYYSHALGYKNDSSCFHNYKILRYSKNRLVFIYDFSSDSWRAVKDVTGRNCIIKCHGVSLEGNAYWFATDKKDPMGKFILMFDFTTERFGRLRLPLVFYTEYYSYPYSKERAALSVVGEDKLALLYQGLTYMDTSEIKIWTTDTKLDDAKQVSWIHLMSADLSYVRLPICAPSFLWDEENQVVVCCDIDKEDGHRTIIYIVGEEIHETMYKEVTPVTSLIWPFLFNYVPNLVQIIQEDASKRKRKLPPRW